ncbi:MAG TPA: dihydroorotate dehydrogenase-like protein [Burkholderiaceae bacterium]|nr:dihydroorotate dehydrogenase-like protein [Burkholderiaceae bacterium]HQR72153.1 dihydroorotate dehydrogenase-like protein [Burkholderiaceae bacterium]
MSIDLSTRYLGLRLAHPVVASASPLTGSIDSLKRLEDAGAAAVVLPSLFEEQIEHDEMATHNLMLYGAELSPEARGFFPEQQFSTGPDRHLQLIADAKKALAVPVIASLNGYTPGGWTGIARQFEQAGADAIELNVYFLATNLDDSSAAVEQRYIDLVKSVAGQVRIPVAVKVAPYFSAMANMASRLSQAGASGLVLFNRFLQPDIELEDLQVAPHLVLSTSDELRLALRWIAILRGRVKASLAATGGAHTPEDVLKLLLAGADCVMIASSLLRKGPAHIGVLVRGVREWLAEREYASVEQMKGSLSQQACPDPDAFERSNYMKALKSYTSEYV